MLDSNQLVLFQGDSITDCSRDPKTTQPNESWGLGRGYAQIAAGQILAARPDDNLRFLNKGISGNVVSDLADRWQKHCLEIKPDVLSILIGVNDIWRVMKGESEKTAEDFNQAYRLLLDVTMSELPDVKLVICEPFVLRCGGVDERWFPDFDVRREMVHQIASDYNATLVEFQTMFDEAVNDAPPASWARDGVHPTLPGHVRMANWWIETVTGMVINPKQEAGA